mgnify:CR=1 FL=1
MIKRLKKKKQIQKIKKEKINHLGVHFHRKTQNVSEWNLVREREGIFDVDEVIIGGGIPSSYANTNDAKIQFILPVDVCFNGLVLRSKGTAERGFF